MNRAWLITGALALGVIAPSASAADTNRFYSESTNIRCVFNKSVGKITCATFQPKRSVTLLPSGKTRLGKIRVRIGGPPLAYGQTWWGSGHGGTVCAADVIGIACANDRGGFYISKAGIDVWQQSAG